MESYKRELEDLSKLVPGLTFIYLEKEIKIYDQEVYAGSLEFKDWIDTEYDVTHVYVYLKDKRGRKMINKTPVDQILVELGINLERTCRLINKELEELNDILPIGLRVGTDGDPIAVIRKLKMMLAAHFEAEPGSDSYFEAEAHFKI